MSGPLDHTPAQIIQYMLEDLSLATLPSNGQGASDWPVFLSGLPNDPDNAIMVRDTAGIQNGRFMTDGEQQENFGFTIVIRSNKYTTAFTKAKAIKIALQETVLRTSVTIGSDVYLIQAIHPESGPIDAGKEEESQRRLVTVNAVVNVRQTA